MSWIKLDDQIFTNPKIIDLSKDAKLLYMAGLCYCGAQLTDGAITGGAARVLLATIEANCEAIASLIDAGLWEANTNGGFYVHDYLEHQSSRDEVLAVKGARAKAGQAGGVRSGVARRAKREANEANYEANGQAKSKQIQSTDTDTDVDHIESVPAPAPTGRKLTPGVNAPKPTPATALPRDWAITEDLRSWAMDERGLNADQIEDEHAQFCNYYWSIAHDKRRGQRADWHAVERGWFYKREQFTSDPKQQKGSNTNGYESRTERNERILRARVARWQTDLAAGDADHEEPLRLPTRSAG